MTEVEILTEISGRLDLVAHLVHYVAGLLAALIFTTAWRA